MLKSSARKLEHNEDKKGAELHSSRSLFVGGLNKTSGQLGWCLILLGNDPEIQKRLQKEIDSVVPRDRLPSLDDRAKLPYLEAAILEIMRMRTGIPMGVPHSTLNETNLCGYNIRSDALVCYCGQIYCALCNALVTLVM